MKRKFAVGLGVAAVLLAVPCVGKLPAFSSLWDAGSAIARPMQHPRLQLNLVGEKQVIRKDAQGKETITWQGGDKLAVQSGDRVRYRLMGKNAGDSPIQNLTLNQPVPQGTAFVLSSARVTSGQSARITYSIDGGRSFVATPTIQVTLPNGKVETRLAPAEAYTHIRWNLPSTLTAKAQVNAEYQVNVR